VAPIKVSNLTVKGKVQGRVKARGKVVIGKTGSVKGDIVAPSLSVESGGKIQGFLRICPSADGGA
jgi:cytoskeletal protein CcmA (bactofilin family)